MIRRDEQRVARPLAGLPDAADGDVGGLDGADGGLVIARVSDHVGRGEIAHDKGIASLALCLRLQRLNDAAGDLINAHGWLQVVGCHLGRGDQLAILPFELHLAAPVEEKGDVGVLFRLGRVELAHALPGQPLGQHIV